MLLKKENLKNAPLLFPPPPTHTPNVTCQLDKSGNSWRVVCVNPFTPRVSYGDIKVILASESVDEILWCDHSNETSSAVLSHGTIYI